MATVFDQTKYANLDAFKPENMQALLVMFAQNGFLIEDILPLIPSSDEFMWEKETTTTKFDRAIRRGEKGVSQKNAFQLEKKSAKSWEYSQSFDITAQTLRKNNVYNFINVMVKGMDLIGDRLRLTTEMDGLDEIINATDINTVTAVATYASADASDPYLDIVKAKGKIRDDELVMATAIVIGAGDETNLKLSDSVRDVKQYTVDYTEDGIELGKIDGTRVYVSTARYSSGGTLVPVLSGKLIVAAAGYMGELREAMPYEVETDYKVENQVYTVYGKRAIRPIVYRPKAGCLVESI
jgi:hypothetical protein